MNKQLIPEVCFPSQCSDTCIIFCLILTMFSILSCFFFLSLSCIIWYFSFTSFFCNFCKVSTLCFLFFVSLQILNLFISGLTLDSCSCDCYNKVEILQPSVGFSWNYTAADNLILFCITYADKAGKTTKSQYGIR